MTQSCRPASDVSNGGWTTAPLWSKLDDNSDADYVDGSGSNDEFVCTGTSVTDPLVSTGYVLRVRARRWGALGEVAGVKVELLEGSTVRMTLTKATVNRSAFTTYTYTPSAAEVDAIGNHANLRFRVTELNAVTDFASVAWVELEVPTLAVPVKVTGVTATDGDYSSKVRVQWNAAAGADSYKIYRHTSNNFGASTLIKSGASGTQYDDSTVVAGTTYYFWVRGHNSAGDGTQSDPNTGYAEAVPAAPTGLTASDSTYDDRVALSWTASAGATSYKVLRGGSVIASGVTATTYDDTTAVPGTTYSYTVKATNASGDSTASSADNGTRAVASSPPPATVPAGLTASDAGFRSKVHLAWTAYTGATSYDVYRALTDVISASPIATGITEESYDDFDVVPGVTYYYWVKAHTADGVTGASTSDSGTASTRSLRFFRECLRFIVDALFKGTDYASGSALSATPTVEFEGLSSEYAPAPDDSGYSSVPAGAKLGLTHSYDGTDEDQLDANDGTLWLADAGMNVAAGAGDAEILLLYANHGSWKPLVAVVDAFYGNPFQVLGGDSPQIQWSRLVGGVLQFCPFGNDSVVYPFAIEQALYALLGGAARHSLSAGAPTIKVNLLTADAKLIRQHHYLDHIPDSWFCLGEAGAVTILNQTTDVYGEAGAIFYSTDPVFTAPAAGLPDAHFVLMHVHDADPAAALLLLCWELDEPIVFDGTDITLVNDFDLGLWVLNGA